MKTILSLLVLFTMTMADTAMPAFKKYYISGIEFDTKTYCADFAAVIEAQAQKIRSLEAEVAQLQRQLQKELSQKLKAQHKAELKQQHTPANNVKSKSRIIISDKPI